jgi:hypothetical protein
MEQERNPAECPPGESLTAWLKNGSRRKGKKRTPTEEEVHRAAIAGLKRLVPQALRQAKTGKTALLRLILRATR